MTSRPAVSQGIVLQTDIAWPDASIEREVIEAAGHKFIVGPTMPPASKQVEELVARHQPDALLTCWAQVSPVAVEASSSLTIIQRMGVGLDNIAVETATMNSIWVANVPDYCVEEVSDHAVALLLDWARGTTSFDRAVKAGTWDPSGAQLRRVANLTVGIVGLGRIGRMTAAKLFGFGCEVIGNSRSGIGGSIEMVSLDALLSLSDVVILHAPLTEETHHLIDARRIRQMRAGALLINVSRGALVDNDALIAALQSGHLSGAALDVVEDEPAPPRALVGRPDVTVTPHVAFSSDASLAELRRRAAEEVVRVLAGQRPQNPCNTFE